MTKLAAAITAFVAISALGTAQEIGMVTLTPNPTTGEMRVDMGVRPDGEKVYIVRKGQLVAPATVKSSGSQGGSVLSLATADATKITIGDRISLSPTLTAELPLSAYKPSDSIQLINPTTDATGEMVMMGEATAAEEAGMLAAPRLTPRSAGVPLYPAPAVTPYPDSYVLGPYGQGLAAAAPVGTPYLRSPAFAGPPIIYMPQTVTRVLVPASTPYPSQLIPSRNYIYASAPFMRTDIYVNLPYGTYYWPQGYAGTVPVEPQVPAYVTAPASAMMTSEAAYAAGRYIPHPTRIEEVNVTVSSPSTTELPEITPTQEIGGEAVQIMSVSPVTVEPASTPVPLPTLGSTPVPAPVIVNPETIVVPNLPTVSVEPISIPPAVQMAPPPALPSLPGAPAPPPPALPSAPAPLPGLPGAPAPPPALPGAPAPLPGLPSSPQVPPAITPAAMPGAALPGLPRSALPGLPGAPATTPAAPATQAAPPPALPTLPGAPGSPAVALPALPALPAAPNAALGVPAAAPAGLPGLGALDLPTSPAQVN